MSSEFGIYQVTYTPTEWCDSSYVEPSVKMSISGEADLSQMLSFFECFLKASGYEFEGKELRSESSASDFSDVPDKWGTATSSPLWGPVDWEWSNGNIGVKD